MSIIARLLLTTCAVTAMVHVTHAFYDPVIGRFLSIDPIDDNKGQSPYTYVGGDPVNKLDPDGRQDAMPFGLFDYSQAYMNGHPEEASLANIQIARQQNAQLKQFGKDGVFIAGAASAAFGGEAIWGLYEAGSLGTGAVGTTIYMGSNAALGTSISVATSIATQEIDKGKISGSQVGVSAATGFIFGTASGGLNYWSRAIAESTAEEIELAKSQANFTSTLGPYMGMTESQIAEVQLQAQRNVAWLTSYGADRTGAIWTVDTFVSPFVEDFLDEFLKNKLHLDYKDVQNGDRKNCGN